MADLMRVGTISLTSNSHYHHNSSEKKREAAIPTEATSPVNDKSNVPEKLIRNHRKRAYCAVHQGSPAYLSLHWP